MTTVAVVTSIYGSYDELRTPPEQNVPCTWVAVVDRPHDAEGWRQVVEPRPHMHPRMAAKVAKCLPHLYTSADVTIWLDGSAHILSSRFVEMCVEALDSNPWAQWDHPERDCIFPEADISSRMTKYQGQPVLAQVEHYRQMGHKPHSGLWATGCIVRRSNRSMHDGFGQFWLAEQLRWSYQDQLSEPWLIAKFGIPGPAPLPGNLWRNRWVGFGRHLGGDA